MPAGRTASVALLAVLLIQSCMLAPGLSIIGGSLMGPTRASTLPAVTLSAGAETAEIASRFQKIVDPSILNASPVLATGWEALSFGPGGLTPPDVQIAVGPNHVVEAVNADLGVYSKEGVSLATYHLSNLFATGSDFLGDPRIQYDALSGRWFVTVGDFSTGQVLIAASKSTDPTGGWLTHQVPSSPTPNCLDQPILGVGTLNVIVSVNVFSSCFTSPYSYFGAQFWVLNKTELVTGATSLSVWSSANATDVSVHPVRMDGPNPIQYMVAMRWEVLNDTSSFLQLFRVSGSPPGAVSLSETDHVIAKAALPPPAPQRGTFYRLDTADFRIADAVWSRGVLWLGFNELCKGSPSDTACVRLIQLDTTANAIRADFRLSSASRNFFYPALALDAVADLALLAGYASVNDYPGLVATGRLTGDPLGVLQPPVLVKEGAGVEQHACDANTTRCRFGDYFGASADPSDATRMWFAGEFGRGTALGWGTYISSVRMKAMLTLNYSVDSGPAPPRGPALRFVRDGTPDSAVIGTDSATFLADPGTSWQIDTTFSTPSGQSRYVSRASDASRLAGTADRSVSTSLLYQAQHQLTIEVSSGGSVAYAHSSATGTVPTGTKGNLYVNAGRVVNLTALPSSIFWVFTGWTGDLAGSSASGSIAIDGPRSVVARFSLNWAFIAAISTVVVIAAVALLIYLRRRNQRASPLPLPPVPAVPPPPSPPPATPPPTEPPP